MATGYKPIPNPILFDSEEQSRNYHLQQSLSVNYLNLDTTQKCEGCSQLHSQWTILTHQQYIDMKSKASKEGRSEVTEGREVEK